MSAQPQNNLGHAKATDYLHTGNRLVEFRQTMGKLGRIGVNDLVPQRKLWSIQAHRYDQMEKEGSPGIEISLRHYDFSTIGIFWDSPEWAISAYEAYIDKLREDGSCSSSDMKIQEDWHKQNSRDPKVPIFLRNTFTYYLPGPITGQIVLAEYDTKVDEKALVVLANSTHFMGAPAIPGLTFPLPNLKKEKI